MKARPIIGLTMGDPAGIGPEICLRAMREASVLKTCVPVLFGDLSVIQQLPKILSAHHFPVVPLAQWNGAARTDAPVIVDCGTVRGGKVRPGEISAECGRAGYSYIEKAIGAAMGGKISAVVTAPIHKEALQLSGIKHPGHTEIFTALTKAKRSCMMLYSDKLTVSMVTTHIGYRDVPGKLSVKRVLDVIELTAEAMEWMLDRKPRLGVCGLNPHAGEHGLFGGGEEEKFVEPAVAAARKKSIDVTGPLVPDAVFTTNQRKKFDAIVTLYHDQGHIPFKMLAFDTGVNITLGLPMIRTSVDHGTAFDIAWQGKAAYEHVFGNTHRGGNGRGQKDKESFMIGVIADDLTGAAEIGAIGLRYGLRSQILTNGKNGGDADLLCVDTDSRACDPEEAAKRVAAAASLLQKAGAAWIYKKVDSVLRGHAVVETEAAMAQLQFNRAVLAPANPSLGRTIRDGRYFVKGRLIHKTEFARDPEHPRTSPDVLDLIDKSRRYPITVCQVDGQLPEQGIALAEAASSADVSRWAKRIETKSMFAAGGAEFFTRLLPAMGYNELSSAEAELVFDGNSKELFICGTLSDSGRDFLRKERARRTPVFSLPVELLWGAEFSGPAIDAIVRRIVAIFQTNSRVILYGGSTVAREKAVSRRLTEFLARLAASVIKEVDVKRIHVEGGATSAQLVRHMGWPRMTVARELAPGVVMLSVDPEHERFLIIKPGSYVWPKVILRPSKKDSETPEAELSVP